MKRFQVTSVDSNNRETSGTKNEVQLNAYNLYSQSNASNGKFTIATPHQDVPPHQETSRKFSFAHLTR